MTPPEGAERERRDLRAETSFMFREDVALYIPRACIFAIIRCLRPKDTAARYPVCSRTTAERAPRLLHGYRIEGGRGGHGTRVVEDTPSGWRGNRKAKNGSHCDDRRRDTIILIAIPQRSSPAAATDVKWSFKNIVAPDV